MKKQLAFVTLIALLVLTFPLNIKLAFSQETSVIYVDPPAVIGLSPSQTFTVAAKIANVTDLCGFDIKLLWNPSLLEYVSHIAKIPVQAYPDGVLNEPLFLLSDEVNETAGTYNLAATTLSSPLNGTDGGTFFEITFRVIAIGQCLLEITGDGPANSAGEPIPHETHNGFFSNYIPTPADIYVSPDKVIDADLTPCHDFMVSVDLDDAVDLERLEFMLGYNATILNATDVTVNPVFPSPIVEISAVDGLIRVNASASPPISGDLLLADITFHVEDTGDSPIDLHEVALVNSFGDAIPYNEPGDGYFSNVLKAKLFVFPEEIIDPAMTPGTLFSIDIQLDDVFDLYGYSFHLSYNTVVLTCLGAVVIPLNTDPNLVTNIMIDDAAGDVAVSVNYFSPAPPITLLTNTTIVTIYFMVESYGCTSLNLHDTLLTNPSGGPIAHDVGDGFFCTLVADVAVLWVEPTRNFVYSGRTVDIIVIAANLGDTTATFNVTAYYDNNTIGTKTVFSLPPSHNETLTFTWNTTGLAPCNNYTFSAYAHPVMYELDFTNNYFENGWVKIKHVGDINNDGVVDIFDIVLASMAYGTRAGDPNYNADVDVAPQYGIIDIFDIVTVAYHYGEGC